MSIKRKWEAWKEEEVELYFRGVIAYDVREFSRIAALVKTKSREQVRHYYYRLLKKINNCLKTHGKSINKQNKEEVKRVLLCWYINRKNGGELTATPPKGSTAAKNLSEALVGALVGENKEKNSGKNDSGEYPTVMSPERPKNISRNVSNNPDLEWLNGYLPNMPVKTEPKPNATQKTFPACSTVSSDPPAKITVHLVPKDKELYARIMKTGKSPFLALTCPSTKKLSKIIEHLRTKWENCIEDCNIMLESNDGKTWGSDNDGITLNDIYCTNSQGTMFKLYYSFISKPDIVTYEIDPSLFAMELLGTTSEMDRMYPTGPPTATHTQTRVNPNKRSNPTEETSGERASKKQRNDRTGYSTLISHLPETNCGFDGEDSLDLAQTNLLSELCKDQDFSLPDGWMM